MGQPCYNWVSHVITVVALTEHLLCVWNCAGPFTHISSNIYNCNTHKYFYPPLYTFEETAGQRGKMIFPG